MRLVSILTQRKILTKLSKLEMGIFSMKQRWMYFKTTIHCKNEVKHRFYLIKICHYRTKKNLLHHWHLSNTESTASSAAGNTTHIMITNNWFFIYRMPTSLWRLRPLLNTFQMQHMVAVGTTPYRIMLPDSVTAHQTFKNPTCQLFSKTLSLAGTVIWQNTQMYKQNSIKTKQQQILTNI
jgi:hypothetical protein